MNRILVASIFASLAVGVLVGHTMLGPGDNTRAASTAARQGGHHGAAADGVDWTKVSSRDLDIAELFVIAREAGARKALRRLEVLAARDTVIRDVGHTLAHGLGRFAVAQREGDPAVYADCLEIFQAGCHHGVMEAYFASPRAASAEAVTPSSLDTLCRAITRVGAARLVGLECAHGMGHGLLARYHGDVRSALGACDLLTRPDARRECHDGVFMENAIRGTASPDVRVGDDAVQAGDSAHQHELAPLVKRGDLAFPCSTMDERYRSACWTYQPIIIAEGARGDVDVLVRTCDGAPAEFIDECYRGVGKQGSGWWENQERVAQLCERVFAARLGACVAGAVESYLDEMWTVDRAISFCGVVSTSAKRGCYEVIGMRLALMRTDPTVVAQECARSEPAYVAACINAAAAGARTRG
ncbi:MAG: hypothetical protein M3125_09370 [Gemmatimonadota bacterium]|nr:hypothetical protein [Gemmatimonadota bacterium]